MNGGRLCSCENDAVPRVLCKRDKGFCVLMTMFRGHLPASKGQAGFSSDTSNCLFFFFLSLLVLSLVWSCSYVCRNAKFVVFEFADCTEAACYSLHFSDAHKICSQVC